MHRYLRFTILLLLIIPLSGLAQDALIGISEPEFSQEKEFSYPCLGISFRIDSFAAPFDDGSSVHLKTYLRITDEHHVLYYEDWIRDPSFVDPGETNLVKVRYSQLGLPEGKKRYHVTIRLGGAYEKYEQDYFSGWVDLNVPTFYSLKDQPYVTRWLSTTNESWNKQLVVKGKFKLRYEENFIRTDEIKGDLRIRDEQDRLVYQREFSFSEMDYWFDHEIPYFQLALGPGKHRLKIEFTQYEPGFQYKVLDQAQTVYMPDLYAYQFHFPVIRIPDGTSYDVRLSPKQIDCNADLLLKVFYEGHKVITYGGWRNNCDFEDLDLQFVGYKHAVAKMNLIDKDGGFPFNFDDFIKSYTLNTRKAYTSKDFSYSVEAKPYAPTYLTTPPPDTSSEPQILARQLNIRDTTVGGIPGKAFSLKFKTMGLNNRIPKLSILDENGVQVPFYQEQATGRSISGFIPDFESAGSQSLRLKLELEDLMGQAFSEIEVKRPSTGIEVSMNDPKRITKDGIGGWLISGSTTFPEFYIAEGLSENLHPVLSLEFRGQEIDSVGEYRLPVNDSFAYFFPDRELYARGFQEIRNGSFELAGDPAFINKFTPFYDQKKIGEQIPEPQKLRLSFKYPKKKKSKDLEKYALSLTYGDEEFKPKWGQESIDFFRYGEEPIQLNLKGGSRYKEPETILEIPLPAAGQGLQQHKFTHPDYGKLKFKYSIE